MIEVNRQFAPMSIKINTREDLQSLVNILKQAKYNCETRFWHRRSNTQSELEQDIDHLLRLLTFK